MVTTQGLLALQSLVVVVHLLYTFQLGGLVKLHLGQHK
jgi:hypothetical protein